MLQRIALQINKKPLFHLLIFSGLVGFCLGISNATWQVCVETAQAISGLVKYPSNSPFYMYHIKAFSIINQLSALLLYAIRSERIVSIIISGLLGMVSFQAIAIFIFAINRNVLMSIIAVIFIFFADYIGDGDIYPIWLMGYQHTYGILGLSFIVFIMALLGAEAYKSAFFFLGLVPCVHASWALWLYAIIFCAAIIHHHYALELVKKYYLYFLAGLIISVLSLIYQIYIMRGLPKTEAGLMSQYVHTYIKYWDSHRRPLYWNQSVLDTGFRRWGVVYCLYSVIAGFLCRNFLKSQKATLFIITTIIIAGIGSLVLGFMTQIPPEKIPVFLLILMPGRYLNLNNLILPSLFLSILTLPDLKSYKTNRNIFWLFMAVAFFSRHDEVQAILFLIILLWLSYLGRKTPIDQRNILLDKMILKPVYYETLLVIFIAIFLIINLPRDRFFNRHIISRSSIWADKDDEFYSQVSKQEGMLLTTHYSSLAALRTRRPVLADMASPNFMLYAPECAPIFNDLLKDIYGIDLFVPPPKEYLHREVHSDIYKELWQRCSVDEWIEIRDNYNVTGILTPSGWKLCLPLIYESSSYSYYSIPEK